MMKVWTMTTKIAEQASAIWTSKEFMMKRLTPTKECHNRTKQAGHSQAGRSWPASFRDAGRVAIPANDDSEAFEQYLAAQSAALGVTIDTLRKAEAKARQRIEQATLSRERLRSLSERTAPPVKYLEGDESCPF